MYYKISKKKVKVSALVGVLCLMASQTFAGSGIGGINAGASELAAYLDPVGNLILAIGAVVGLVGGIRVYVKWNSGDQDVNKEIMGWLGSCIFLVLVSVIIKAFFV